MLRVVRARATPWLHEARQRVKGLLQQPLPFGLPPLGEIERLRPAVEQLHNVMMMKPWAMGSVVTLLCVAACCFLVCCCRACIHRRTSYYQMYAPLSHDAFEEEEERTRFLKEQF